MIAAAAHRPILTQAVVAGDRKFDNPQATRKLHEYGVTRPIGNAVTRAIDGENARVVIEVKFSEHLQTPQRRANDRKIAGTVAANTLADDLFQHVFHAARVFMKLLASLMKDLEVAVAVTGDFVTLAMHA